MSELISRQALCDDLREYKLHPVPISSDESEVKGYNDGIDLAISVIAKFPSVKLERTAKVIEHDASITDTDGYKYHRSEYLCGACKKKVLGGDEYCSHCGCRLIWDEDIPMEYFESGGI